MTNNRGGNEGSEKGIRKNTAARKNTVAHM